MVDQALHRRMTELARDLESEQSAEATLQAVVTNARELVGPCVAAGITLASRQGEVRTSAATDDVPRRGDELQIELGEGPCRDAVWEHHTVLVRHLSHDRRWPSWAPRAAEELGMGSVLCLRLFTHRDRIGALNLYAVAPDAFDTQEVEIGHAVAAHAAVAVKAAEQIEHLEAGLVNRSVIGQAIGLVMQTYELTSTDAFSFLARVSSQTNRKVAVIAQDLVRDHDQQVQRRRACVPPPPRVERRGR